MGAPAAQAYPPTPRTVTAAPTSGTPTFEVTVTAVCKPGELVTFTLEGARDVADCVRKEHTGLVEVDENVAGLATTTINAPETPGRYIGEVSGTSTTRFGSFTVSVLPAEIPNASAASDLQGARTGGEITSRTVWWPVLGAMFAVLLAVMYALRRPLQLSPRR